MRIDETKNMCPHMNSTSSSPLALCTKSNRAGQRLLRLRSVRPAPAMILLLESMTAPSHAGGEATAGLRTKLTVADRSNASVSMAGTAAIDLHQHSRRQHLHRTPTTPDNEGSSAALAGNGRASGLSIRREDHVRDSHARSCRPGRDSGRFGEVLAPCGRAPTRANVLHSNCAEDP